MSKKKKGNPRPKPSNGCCAIKSEVDAYLAKKCANKFNALDKCTKCSIKHKNWPVINTPFDADLLNTGLNAAGGVTPSGTGTDAHWEAGTGTTSNLPVSWTSAYVYRNSAWLSSPYSNANWISVYPDSDHKGKKDVYFRNRFYLNSGVNPGQFVLDLNYYADNSIHEIYVNGVAQSTHYPGLLPQNSGTPYSHVGFKNGKEASIKLAHDWCPCENEIIIQVKSGSPKVGLLAQFGGKCHDAKIPKFLPEVKVKWGDSDCDCIESNDVETMCLTVCNRYSNITFKGLTIGMLQVCDENGNPVPLLPDGNPSVQLVPVGPYCFGDIPPCSCVSREFVLINKGAKAGKYKIKIQGICYDVCLNYANEDCFEFEICKD